MRLGTTTRKLDAVAIQQGVERECPERPGLFVRILPLSIYNPRFKQAIENEAMKIKDGDGDRDYFDSPEFVADVLVADMRGLFDDADNPIEYTPEIGAEIFSDPAHEDVRDWVTAEARSRGQFYTDGVEKKLGNSSAGSSGKKAGAGKSKKTKN